MPKNKTLCKDNWDDRWITCWLVWRNSSLFTHSQEISDASATEKNSYLVADKLALALRLSSVGEFVKTCMLKAAEIVCLEKPDKTVADKISDLSADLQSQLKC